MNNIAVIGTTSWGLTLALVMSRKFNVSVLTRTADEAHRLATTRTTPRLPDVELPANLRFSDQPAAVLKDAEIIFIAVPSYTMRQNLRDLKEHINAEQIIISATKGMEEGSGLTMTTLIAGELQHIPPYQIGVLSGPNLALEVAQEKFAFSTLAFSNMDLAVDIQNRLNAEGFRVYSTNDIIGVEIGGSYKNVIALASGFIDALEVGNNSKSALLTRGLYEMMKFGVSLGARQETFSGLSGLGDLLATCYSKLSRNYRLGWLVCKGKTIKDAQAEIKQVTEGIPTSRAIIDRNKEIGLDLPIVETVYKVVFDAENAMEAGMNWLKRTPKRENTL